MEPESSAMEQTLPSSSSRTASVPAKTETNGLLGKHRMAAALSNLQNQITFLQEELDQLETLGESSVVCKEVISSVESVPDPLLPLSKGPTNESWERWFRGAHNSRRRWI